MKADQPLGRGLALALRIFAAFAMVTGTLDVIFGLDLLVGYSPQLAKVSRDPLIESHLRYLGAVWAGLGALLWWTAQDLLGRAAVLRIAGFTIFLGGLGRSLAAFLYGPGPVMVPLFIAIELLGPPLVLILWRRQFADGVDPPI